IGRDQLERGNQTKQRKRGTNIFVQQI
ncbi:uncharacterized protein METZ01_LOCUS458197, partial [marine metagenome]